MCYLLCLCFKFPVLMCLLHGLSDSSTACNVAMKILAPKYGRLTFHYSKALRLDWFNGRLKYRCLNSWMSLKKLYEISHFPPNTDDFLIGTAAEVFMLRSITNIFPTEILMKGKFFFIGRILQLIEVRHDALQFKLSLNIDISFQSWSVIIFFFFSQVGY